MKILLTVLAAVALLAATGFTDSAASRASKNHTYAFAVGTHGPGCPEDAPPPGVPACYQVSLTYRLLAVQRGHGHAWGVFSRFNHGTGLTRTGEVTCMTVADGKAAVGGIETTPSGLPFLLYVEDRGPIGSPVPDRISQLSIYPEDDPEWPALPPDFPRTCPSPSSLYGYFPLTSGDVTVTEEH